GERALLRVLLPLLLRAKGDRPIEVLDVGTGTGDLPLAMVRTGRNLRLAVRVTAVDIDATTARAAAAFTSGEGSVRILRADATALPFRESSFDVVTCSMFLHHFPPDDVVRLLSSFRRLARRAVLVNDLRRHRIPWAFIAVASRMTFRHPMFVHDAPLSVLRGFTDEEMRSAARAAGDDHATVRRLWPFRLVLTLG